MTFPDLQRRTSTLPCTAAYCPSRPARPTRQATGICSGNQRPGIIDKKIRLPAYIKRGEEEISSAKLEDGVLTLIIPLTKRGKSIPLD